MNQTDRALESKLEAQKTEEETFRRLLLGIDLQNDFCHPEGKLAVKGAKEDLERIINLIEVGGEHFNEVIISMDSHYPLHIAHPSFWRNQAGEMPEPFTIITYDEVIKNKWIPQYYQEQVQYYLKTLQSADYQCTIWPPHCLIGTEGWALPEALYFTLSQWSHQKGRNFELYNKGSNPFTEHYSILQAAVPFREYPATCLDQTLLQRFSTFDEIIIVGEAMDFCVANTIDDILKNAPHIMRKMVILTDCMSSIIPENEAATKIYQKAEQLGARMMLSQHYLQTL